MKPFFSSLIAVVVLLVLALWLFPSEPARDIPPPWQIETTENNSIRVMGITLRQTRLQQVVDLYGEPPEVSLFEDTDGSRQLEAFFQTLDLNGLRARMVLVLLADDITLQRLYDQGARIQNVESGGKRISLNKTDLALAFQLPVRAISYLPKTDLPEDILEQRFGQPAEKRPVMAHPDAEADSEKAKEQQSVEWIYPQKQLQITVSDSEREVLHYGR